MGWMAWRTLVFLAVAGALGLAGCGQEETPTAARESQPAAAQAAVPAAAAQEPAASLVSATLPITPVAAPRVALKTTLGEIVLELDPQRAPTTVENFLAYIASGGYDGTVFHQVWKDYVIVGGSYDAQLNSRPTRNMGIRNEAHNGLRNTRGTIAMARVPDSAHSATNQFFFNMNDNAGLDHRDQSDEGYGYCVFGQVVQGLDVLDRINALPVQDSAEHEQMPVETVLIESARLLR